jgi:hypothetical protein
MHSAGAASGKRGRGSDQERENVVPSEEFIRHAAEC